MHAKSHRKYQILKCFILWDYCSDFTTFLVVFEVTKVWIYRLVKKENLESCDQWSRSTAHNAPEKENAFTTYITTDFNVFASISVCINGIFRSRICWGNCDLICYFQQLRALRCTWFVLSHFLTPILHTQLVTSVVRLN